MDKKNKVPGCDRLTRPEEIDELKKYLREVKDVQEEYVENEFNNLEAPGITTGRFPKVNELPETIVELDTKKNIENLYDKNQSPNIEILGGDFKEPELGNRVEKIEDSRKINLNQVSEKLDGEFKTTELGDRIERIQNNRDVELNRESEKLNSGAFKNPELGIRVEKIKTEDVSELYDAEYTVPNNQGGEVTSLGDQLLKLHDSRSTELGDKVEELKEGEFKEPGLTSFIDTLDDNRKPELGDKVKSLKTGAFKNPELENRVESLSKDKEVSELYDSEYSVPDNLGGEVGGLYESVYATPDNQGGEINSLENHKENIRDERKEKLESRKENLEGIEEVDNLSKYEKIFKVLDDIEEREGAEGYINKLRSLISAYLVNDSINQAQAQQYLDKLQGCFIEYRDEGLEELAPNNPEGNKRLYYIDNNEDPENIRSTFKVHQNLEKIEASKSEEAREDGKYHRDDLDKSYIEKRPGHNSDAPESIDIDRKVEVTYNNQPVESIAPVNPGEARETKSGEYDFIGENEEVAKRHIGAREDGTRVKSGTYLRPYYELPFLSELRNGEAVSANIGNTLSSVGVNDMGVTNINSYIRQIAEWVGDLSAGTGLREMLINETLHLLVALRRQLEVITNANKDRLPGNNNGLTSSLIQGGVSGAINSAIDAGINAISARPETDQPLNRPDENGDRTPTTAANNRVEWTSQKPLEREYFKNFGKNFVNSFWSESGEGFKDNYTEFKSGYMLGQGIYTTLMELCKGTNPSNINSVEDLKNILKSSPYITTPSKFGTIQDGLYRTTTLDTNSNWEIVIEPFCSKSMNGGFSYLPAIQEINIENYYKHGVRTHYNMWVPFTNFSLQKSRLNSKTLGLFDGEISYPVSAELMNELRLTIVDDQYKSWRHYFQKCMDVSVYNSQAHSSDYYYYGRYNDTAEIATERKGFNYLETTTSTTYTEYNNVFIPTAVDKSNICVALYKNITFRIRIYVMTPQFSTIRKFDLLCVLKDFLEEYEGDIDAPGPDLNLVFSIVGENPDNKETDYDGKIMDWDKFGREEFYSNSLTLQTRTTSTDTTTYQILE